MLRSLDAARVGVVPQALPLHLKTPLDEAPEAQFESGLGDGQQRDAAHVGELQSGLGIGRVEDLLDGDGEA